MNSNQYCIIMAGGHLNRFWPISREDMPGHFLDISGSGKSLVRMAYDRCVGVVPHENIIVVTLSKFKDMVLKQIPELSEDNLLLEPQARRTGPCVAYSTYTLLKRNPDAVMAVTPSDLIIKDEAMFRKALSDALDYASANPVLMTLGVKPSRPDTEFGYIQAVGGREACSKNEPVKVKTFTEKPDKEIAEVFYKSGEFFWNSGIFVWKASLILEEIKTYAPQISDLWQGSSELEKFYGDCPRVSIDYAVMENTERASVIPARFKWADMGNWNSLFELLPKDQDGNAAKDCSHRLFKDDSGLLCIQQDKGKLVAVKGLKDYMIIDTPDVLLICPREDSQIQDLLSELAMPQYEEYR